MDKQQPLGTCDLCLGPIPRDEWYTSKGTPRLHCSPECKNAANSRAGSPIRSRKAKARVARGEWQNPAKLNPPTHEEQSRRSRLARQREVKAGTWRNPALADRARQKLSRPRKYHGALHRAIEKLNRGSTKDLTPTEHRAWLKHRRELRLARPEADRRYHRDYYRRQQSKLTPTQRKAQHARWREQNKRRKKSRTR